MGQTIIGSTKPPVKEETILPKEYKHTLIESRYIPHTSMLSNVPGTPTRTWWYRGSYGTSEEQHQFEPESIETYASYKLIHDLIVKIDNGNGAFNFNPVNRQASHRLSGYVLFDLVPNKGDLFIKDVGDGRAGLYAIVEQPEIKTIYADKVYYFEAELQAFMTQAIQDNLDKKTIEHLYYSKDSAINGGNAVLTADDFTLNKRLYDMQVAIIDDIMANHYFWDEDTICIPNSDGDWLYDPYLAKFLSYVFPTALIGARKKITTLSVQYYVDNRQMQDPITIWDMFYRNDFSNPQRYKQDYYVHPRNNLINTRFYGNVFFSKFDRAIVIHKEGAPRNPYLYSGALIPAPVPNPPRPPGEGTKWDYFFGDDFYAGGGTETQKFVWKMFKEKTIDKAELMKVLEGYWSLDDVSKLYMSGIYVGAIKTALVTNSNYT